MPSKADPFRADHDKAQIAGDFLLDALGKKYGITRHHGPAWGFPDIGPEHTEAYRLRVMAEINRRAALASFDDMPLARADDKPKPTAQEVDRALTRTSSRLAEKVLVELSVRGGNPEVLAKAAFDIAVAFTREKHKRVDAVLDKSPTIAELQDAGVLLPYQMWPLGSSLALHIPCVGRALRPAGYCNTHGHLWRPTLNSRVIKCTRCGKAKFK